jgi:hypothetical protein
MVPTQVNVLHRMGYRRILVRFIIAYALVTTHNFSIVQGDQNDVQMPKQVAAGLMFGTALSVPVPDLERTEYLLLPGANPPSRPIFPSLWLLALDSVLTRRIYFSQVM